MSTSEQTPERLLRRIDRRQEDLEAAEAAVAEYGEDDLSELADAYQSFRQVLEIYQDQVTGDDGDIKTIVEFQSEVDRVMSEIPDGVLHAETFDECDEYLQQKWFSDADFEHVYDLLEPVADLVERLDERDEALAAYRDARRDLERRARELETEMSDLERLLEMSDVDLDAPTERIREPIERYNDAVDDAFRAVRQNEPARDVIVFLQRMDAFPLVGFESPPAVLAEYVLEQPPGAEPIPTLLEYADYSHSKLSHYVDDPDRLKHVVERHQAYLDRLDSEPLRIDWPPPPAADLQWRCRELTAAVNRLDPSVVEHLRAVASLPREYAYERLRKSAVVDQDLSAAERDRLQSGNLAADLEQRREEYDRLQSALAEYPER